MPQLKRSHWVYILLAILVVGSLGYTVIDNRRNDENNVLADNRDQNDQDIDSPDNSASSEPDLASLEIPDLPFEENPDPNECGIPQPWGTFNNQAWLTGYYEGEMIQPVVYLYDSHGRNQIVATAPHGTEVEIVLFQANPVLNYYFVKIPGAPAGQHEGWVPAPLLSLEPAAIIG